MKGTLIEGLVIVVGFVLMPAALKEQILGALTAGRERLLDRLASRSR